MNYLNLLKPLEYALHQGCDGYKGNFIGRKSPDVTEYSSFNSLLDEYKKQLAFLIDQVIEVANGFENHLAFFNPQSLLSAIFPSCIEQGKDAFEGGACSNNTGLLCGFMADIADSLAMIKKYVFDKKELTLKEFVDRVHIFEF